MKRTALLVSILWSGLAAASGFEFPDTGTVAQGRGSAFAAKADDGTALYYNPAGLADQDGWRVTLDVTVGDQSTSFQRTDAAGLPLGPEISNSPGVFAVPYVAISRQILPGLTVAVGAYAPPANGTLKFPDETPPVLSSAQRLSFLGTGCLQAPAPSMCPGANTSSANTAPQKYMFINDTILVLYPTIAAAWSPLFLPMLSVGGSLQLLYGSTAFRKATYDGAALESQGQGGGTWTHSPAAEQQTFDTMANASVSGATVTGNLGFTLKPLPFLRVGASYKPKSTLTQTGTLKLDFSPLAQSLGAKTVGPGTSNAADGSSGQGPASLVNSFPGELKTGVDYLFGLGDIELDFDYTQWSQYQSAVLTPSFSQQAGAGQPGAIPALNIIRDFQDTWSLRLGGDVNIPVPVVRLTVRAGVGYESSMYNSGQTQYVTIDYANFDQVWGSLGATVGVGKFDFDLAYSHVYMPQHDVTNSGVAAVQNNPPANDPAIIVGNGKFNTAYDLLALGVRAHF